MDMDQLVGADFERGLASMKEVSEAAAKKSKATLPNRGRSRRLAASGSKRSKNASPVARPR
jgi:hypothetical protein